MPGSGGEQTSVTQRTQGRGAEQGAVKLFSNFGPLAKRDRSLQFDDVSLRFRPPWIEDEHPVGAVRDLQAGKDLAVELEAQRLGDESALEGGLAATACLRDGVSTARFVTVTPTRLNARDRRPNAEAPAQLRGTAALARRPRPTRYCSVLVTREVLAW